MAILVCNIGWMRYYRGQTDDDAIERGGSYVDEHGVGHEICNYFPHAGWLYGYVQASGQISISKLGASQRDGYVDGVTVVWTATRPKGGTVVVGWYRDARVYRSYEPIPNPGAEWSKYGIERHNIRCRPRDAKLLAIDERTLEVPRGKGGMGQSPIWYAEGARGQEFREQVARLIKDGSAALTRRKRGATDPVRNKLVETAAMEAVTTHYVRLGYEVKWVHNENKGWDIEARTGRTELRIEVKGLSLSVPRVELTPNEYRAFKSLDSRYRLAIVTQALSNAPELAIVSYNGRSRCWEVDGEARTRVDTKEVIAAQISIT